MAGLKRPSRTSPSAQAELRGECHEWGMVASTIVELRESGVSLPTILEAFPKEERFPDLLMMFVAEVYADSILNQGNAYVLSAKICEETKAKQ